MGLRRLKDISTDELESMILCLFENINTLKFDEFMANTVTEKAIVREQIYRIENTIVNYRWFIKERNWEIEDAEKERKANNN